MVVVTDGVIVGDVADAVVAADCVAVVFEVMIIAVAVITTTTTTTTTTYITTDFGAGERNRERNWEQ